MLPYFFSRYPENILDIRNNYFRYGKTIFLISKILVFFLVSQNIISDIRKTVWISSIKYPFRGILDIQNTSKILIFDIQNYYF